MRNHTSREMVNVSVLKKSLNPYMYNMGNNDHQVWQSSNNDYHLGLIYQVHLLLEISVARFNSRRVEEDHIILELKAWKDCQFTSVWNTTWKCLSLNSCVGISQIIWINYSFCKIPKNVHSQFCCWVWFALGGIPGWVFVQLPQIFRMLSP